MKKIGIKLLIYVIIFIIIISIISVTGPMVLIMFLLIDYLRILFLLTADLVFTIMFYHKLRLRFHVIFISIFNALFFVIYYGITLKDLLLTDLYISLGFIFFISILFFAEVFSRRIVEIS